ncbi:hypothetical protein DsansV1_C11g0108151 [Dioscorea sansibarensis]
MVSYRWAHMGIMAGTILGGVLGFYVMHRVEISYKEMNRRLRTIIQQEGDKRLSEMMTEQEQEEMNKRQSRRMAPATARVAEK